MKTRTKTTRILTVILILSLLVLAFSGCASDEDDAFLWAPFSDVKPSAYQQYMGWLKQYEKWVDSYIDVCKNYEKNPTSYMSAYLTKTAELADWTAKFSNVKGDDLTSAEAAKISNEYLRIYNKMMKAVSEMD